MLSIESIWTEKMNIGIEPLDDHHRTMLRLMLDVRAAAEGTTHPDDIRGVLSSLVSYSKYHFLAEERIMLERGFPELELQRAEHRWYVEKMDSITAACAAGHDAESGKELLEYLQRWFVGHILTHDLRLKTFTRQEKAGPEA